MTNCIRHAANTCLP